jgi:hypothetical protein
VVAIGFNQVTVWDVQTGKVVAARGIDDTSEFAVLSPDCNAIALLHTGRQGIQDSVALQDTVTGKERASVYGKFGYFLGLNRDGQTLAVASPPSGVSSLPVKDQVHGVSLIRVADGKTVFQIKTPPLGQLAFSPDGHTLATAHADALRIWEIASGKELFCIKRPENFHWAENESFVKCLTFMPSCKALVTGMDDGTVLIWDLTPEGWSTKDLDRKAHLALWSDLAVEGPDAYRAIWTLVESPQQAVPFLKEQVKPVEEVDAKLVQRLLTDLDSEQFETREKAAKELALLGERIDPILRRVLEGNASEEARKRVIALLDERAVPSGETLRTLRAIQVLERIGTKEAREVLKKLAGGAEAARETLEANEALVRLSRNAELDR